MPPLRLMHVIGARPQFIKYFPMQLAIDSLADGAVANRLVHTGQHYDYGMSKVFFDQLGIRTPDVHLEVGSGSHGRQTSLIVERVESVLREDPPDILVVYGDTNSTLGAALAGAKLHVPIAHIEAGLRSYRKAMPEEINRVLTDHMSTWLFCPSARSAENLAREGFAVTGAGTDPDADHPVVAIAGDVMRDALVHSLSVAERRSTILQDLALEPGQYTLLTLHRAENSDAPAALAAVIGYVNDVTTGPVVFPMHPRMVGPYERCGARLDSRIRVVPPVGYFDALRLLKSARQVFTDSGGMQKEAYWLGVPCVTLREETEWTETIDAGWNTLYRDYPRAPSARRDPDAYGDGHAAEAIIRSLLAAGSR